jgi:hypothetical protein
MNRFWDLQLTGAPPLLSLIVRRRRARYAYLPSPSSKEFVMSIWLKLFGTRSHTPEVRRSLGLERLDARDLPSVVVADPPSYPIAVSEPEQVAQFRQIVTTTDVVAAEASANALAPEMTDPKLGGPEKQDPNKMVTDENRKILNDRGVSDDDIAKLRKLGIAFSSINALG